MALIRNYKLLREYLRGLVECLQKGPRAEKLQESRWIRKEEEWVNEKGGGGAGGGGRNDHM